MGSRAMDSLFEEPFKLGRDCNENKFKRGCPVCEHKDVCPLFRKVLCKDGVRCYRCSFANVCTKYSGRHDESVEKLRAELGLPTGLPQENSENKD